MEKGKMPKFSIPKVGLKSTGTSPRRLEHFKKKTTKPKEKKAVLPPMDAARKNELLAIAPEELYQYEEKRQRMICRIAHRLYQRLVDETAPLIMGVIMKVLAEQTEALDYFDEESELNAASRRRKSRKKKTDSLLLRILQGDPTVTSQELTSVGASLMGRASAAKPENRAVARLKGVIHLAPYNAYRWCMTLQEYMEHKGFEPSPTYEERWGSYLAREDRPWPPPDEMLTKFGKERKKKLFPKENQK